MDNRTKGLIINIGLLSAFMASGNVFAQSNVVVLGSWLLGGSLQQASADLAPGSTDQIQLREPHPDQATLESAFTQAAVQYGVPVEILRAVGFVESRWIHAGPTIDNGYGIMHLVNNSDAATLSEAANLTGLSIDDLKLDPIANIQGGAAVIAHYVKKTVGTAKTWRDYWEALKRFSGLTESVQEKQALEYFKVLAEGIITTNALGMNIQLAPVDGLDLSTFRSTMSTNQVASEDYGPAIWNPAASCNYETTRLASIDHWINHWIGSGTYAGTISWFKNCNAETSSHFVIRQSDGEITQMVRIAHKAWTTGYMNSRSIGVEHEATPSYPWPQSSNAPMIVASATCCRYFCNLYGIPKTRTYITGHSDYYATACPGNLPWDIYLAVVNGDGGPCAGGDNATCTAESWPYDYDTVTCGQVFQKSWTVQNNGTSTWTKACNFKWAFDGANQGLGTQAQFGTPGWTELGDSEAIAPGQSKTWTLTFTAPSTPGLYEGDYRMDRYGTARFGVTVWILVNVVAVNGNLDGTVTNASTGAGIAGATVTLGGVGNTTTNASGGYSFSNITSGSYTVSVSATGFNGASADVSINAGTTTTQNFSLVPSDTQAPSTPTLLTATAGSPSSVALTWSASTDNIGVTGYEVRRNGTVIGSSTTTSYTDSGLTTMTTYTYDVRAKDAVPNYSAWSNQLQATTPPPPPVSTVVFSDGFDGNLNNWTQLVENYDYSTTINHGTLTGAGAAYLNAAGKDQMYHIFTRPFAQGKVSAYFYDGKGGWKAGTCGWAYRQSLSLRDYDSAAKMYIDNEFYSASDNSKYFNRLIGVGGGTHTAYATRNPDTDCNGAWVAFETSVVPAAPGSSPTGTFTTKVTDGAGTTSATGNLSTDYYSYGFARITLGLGNSSANEGYWDDISFEAMPPGVPTMNAATVVSATEIRWNFTAADNNFFGTDVADAAGTMVSPQWPNAGWLDHNATSWSESALTPNTEYSRKVRTWNGTLNSAIFSNTMTARTLSVSPDASSIVANTTTPLAGENVVWTAVNGFGPGKVQYYRYAWDTNPTHTFTDSEATWSGGTLPLVPTGSGVWYLHVKGYNAADVGNGTFDYSVTATSPAPPTVTTAVSRKTHGSAGVFDIDVLAAGAVEPRKNGPTLLLVTFDQDVQQTSGTVSDVSLSSGTVSALAISGNQLTVTMSGAADIALLTVGFPGIRSASGQTATGNVCFAVLSGDVTGDRKVNVFDLQAAKNTVNQPVTALNFRDDITADGGINVFDMLAVKNNLNKTIAGSCP